jgi:hypothetical protein
VAPGGGIRGQREAGSTVPRYARGKIFSKKSMSGTSGEQLSSKDDLSARQKDLWAWAAARLTPWGKPQKDDYDFRWAKDASEELLSAGWLYEYARESHKFRCLLVLDNRPREQRDGRGLWIKLEGSTAYW